ncbi:intradiol ring-cleavage dioxygenase [Brevundimonas lenta]|uniref:Protocatechuate 3,4-dioxygenase beta subunit n=1 Tax=Brevundimonas lenta TaxID=424796 RepID=A0A7W6JF72_9CAUL|nr:intradiol ring-cleavage dioxygenase [Brevundimonas lenta]MBB4084029.1 protocatechuate 3,4-dioxygenase beta subunit [Brevundimonas lenta]
MAHGLDRRALVAGGAGLITLGSPLIARAQSVLTPPQIEGPFYPYALPPEYDTDLVKLGAGDARAMGEVTHLLGTVWYPDGTPMADALVEIWQCDVNGRYRHPDDHESRTPDLQFQGYGRTTTGRDGTFHFRTIKPVSYTVTAMSPPLTRAPHVHVAVSTHGVRRLTSQLYVAGEPLNDGDMALAMVADPVQRAGLIRPYEDGAAFEPGALTVRYDLVVMV